VVNHPLLSVRGRVFYLFLTSGQLSGSEDEEECLMEFV
jgi:hypothetical protein